MKIGTLFNAGPADRDEWREAGARMREERKTSGLNMGDEAQRRGISVSELSAMERVRAEPVKAETALARFTGNIGSALKADALAVLSIKVKPVETTEQATKLADQRAGVKLLLKDIEDRRKRIVEPIKKEAQAVDAEAHRWADPLVAWDKDAERVLLAFKNLDADRKRREELERQKAAEAAAVALSAAEDAGDAIAAEAASVAIMQAEAVPVEAPVRGFKTEAGTTSLRTVWKVEVVDPAEVPDAYWMLDLTKLQKAVDAGAREIPGCHIHEVESLPVRTRG